MIPPQARKGAMLPLAVIDLLPLGAVLCDADGALLHASPRAIVLLGMEDESDMLAALQGINSGAARPTPLRVTRHELPDQHQTLYLIEDRSAELGATNLRDDAWRALSHDLRSPLGAILTLTESVADGTLPPDPQTLQQVGHYAELALARADGVLRLLRADALHPEQFEPVSVEQIAWEASDACWKLARDRQITINVDADAAGEDALVRGDVDALRRAVTHLLENTVVHGPANASVRLSVEGDASHWSFVIRDQGNGPDNTALSVLCAAQRSGRPRGLGLAYVRRVADRHGARISCAHDADGFCVTLELPKWPAELPHA